MGVLNCTPDSFSDGGDFYNAEKAVKHGLSMLESGADMVDIGGESTRPGSESVSIDEELERVIPVISMLKKLSPESIISIDTQKAEVAEAAAETGADIINDVSGLQHSPKIADIAAKYRTGLVLMHMLGTPKTMQKIINYNELLEDIRSFLLKSADTALKSGVRKEQIIIDPGIGFGKTYEHNLEIYQIFLFSKKLAFRYLLDTQGKLLSAQCWIKIIHWIEIGEQPEFQLRF